MKSESRDFTSYNQHLVALIHYCNSGQSQAGRGHYAMFVVFPHMLN